MTLIALVPAGQGALTELVDGSLRAWFGPLRWLLPFFLLAAGWWLEWGPGQAARFGLGDHGPRAGHHLRRGARRAQIAGRAPAAASGARWQGRSATCSRSPAPSSCWSDLPSWASSSGSGSRSASCSTRRSARRAGSAPRPRHRSAGRHPTTRRPPDGPAPLRRRPTGAAAPSAPARPGLSAAPSPGSDRRLGRRRDVAIPAAIPSPRPVSSTFAPARGAATSATLVAPVRPVRDLDDVTDASDSPPTRERMEYILPPIETLDDVAIPVGAGGDEPPTPGTRRSSSRSWPGFGIPARIVGRNAGPVVTQYEVQPAPDIKVSRIEGLSDDLAMALAARSLRIEAPIPGKSAVGHRDPEQGLQRRRPPADPRGGRLQGVGVAS